jgi:tetratricopeptide (TPR) repeat protein
MRRVLLVISAAASVFIAPAGRAQELGSISFPTSGATAAQPEFVRGVLFMHSFEYRSAAEAFRRAQALDPRYAMAYWGEALTYTHQVWNEQDMAAARAVLQRLGPTPQARLAAAPTSRERAYLAAVEALYGDGAKARRDTLYATAMEQMTRDWPDDDEALVLYATSLFGLSQGVRDVPLYMRAGAIAQDVFRRNPRHPGAAHMVIHAFDDPVHAPLGLYAARQYSQIAPAAAHAQHMTTHIFLALGMWRDVAAQNVIAAGPDSSRWQPGHYTHWLLYAYLQQGRHEAARALLASLLAHAAGRAQARGPLANFRTRYVVETGRWDSPEARALDTDVGAAGEDGYEYATFAAGYAAAKRGDRARAAQMLDRLVQRNGPVTTALKPGASGADAVPVIMELSLRAELARQDGKVDSAIVLLRRATTLEDGMPAEFGPPAVVAPSHELLGGLLFAAGRTDEASEQYAKALQLQPGRSAALLGSARAEGARGRTAAAGRAYRQLVDNWRPADAGIAGLTEARSGGTPGKTP